VRLRRRRVHDFFEPRINANGREEYPRKLKQPSRSARRFIKNTPVGFLPFALKFASIRVHSRFFNSRPFANKKNPDASVGTRVHYEKNRTVIQFVLSESSIQLGDSSIFLLQCCCLLLAFQIHILLSGCDLPECLLKRGNRK